jgi:YggT family protein
MIVSLFLKLLNILQYIIIADSLLSWVVPDKAQFPRSMTSQIVDPLCLPFRKLLPPERTGGLDLAPLIALLVLYLMSTMIIRSFN